MKSAIHKNQSGLTLIELMLALAISMVLTLGAITVFQSNKQTNNVQEQMSRVQENGRMALSMILADIRGAGFVGCGSLSDPVGQVDMNIIADPPPPSGFGNENVVVGHYLDSGTWKASWGSTTWSNGNTTPAAAIPPGIKAGTEAISLMASSDCGAYLVGNTDPNNANVQINKDNTCGFQQYDPVIITDCQDGDIFRIASNPTSTAAKMTLSHPNSVNTANKLSKIYSKNAKIFKPTFKDYYIADDATNLDRNGNAIPTLYVRHNGYSGVPVVAGVNNLTFRYGLDTDNNKSIDLFTTADDVDDNYSWTEVISVEVTLTIQSVRNVVGGNLMTKTFTLTGTIRNRAL